MLQITKIPPQQPVLIAGPTASGKSGLALDLAERDGGLIINADALQVYANWRVLTARPSEEEEARAPHALYGHVDGQQPYSVGEWLREVKSLLEKSALRPIIIGGTGLYFRALTEGLADIPPTPAEVRAEADALAVSDTGLAEMLSALDAATLARIDQQNPMRVQRAFEVWCATGRSLADWHASTPPPLLPLSQTSAYVLNAPRGWLTPRIESRFDIMLESGALEEAKRNLAAWSPTAPSSKAIGAPELIAHLKGEITLKEARARAIIASRQYAKRQRTWFKARMKGWNQVNMDI
ncbi:tRNA (adenosine(37)-N6)-dimethylallyltransferase MiaA [Lentibacter algarum]|uniref:tRNA (adenosine(37)-N6)-dimethylallyltransferase MiaA n=1 Tax=Lentibacter algarum TaxID=576131 RepID=UPI001C082AD6|nr:tRNA (adenosine(37)-N6)-dimethylallyltransferase MiaA [Lentibacter algarum]MBU2982490.1 tRNA (adenosine(37)-N6)-dimethylallyltransferase MiaA [Lentibacter algarum]